MAMVSCQVALQFDRVIAIVVCRFLINNQRPSIGCRLFIAFFRKRYGFFTAKLCLRNKLCLPFLYKKKNFLGLIFVKQFF